MMRYLYRILFPLAFLVLLPPYLVRMVRRGNFRRDFGQRLARYRPELLERFSRGPWIWVHAVSVGELLIALKLLAELHRRRPDWQFVVSSTTSTAHAMALARQESWWVPVYTPVDLAGIARRALRAVRPRAIILTEGEMWPNFVWTASGAGCPVALVNARVSPRSEGRYRKFAALVRPVARHLEAVGLQEQVHASLWSHLGVPQDRLHLTGSVKYDPETQTSDTRDFRPVLDAFGFDRSAPVLLAGSTHEGEEELLAEALTLIRRDIPHTRLIIAPRHVERTASIVARLREAGHHVARRSGSPEESAPPPDILLLDTTGELRDWYQLADVVFIGKSLRGHGGQNPVEAILAAKPVLFGPHMENFAHLRDALRACGGALEVRDAESLAGATMRLLGEPGFRQHTTNAALTALAPHRGATARTADMVERLVMNRDSGAGGGYPDRKE